MSWLDFLSRKPAPAPVRPPVELEIPLFPLAGVLFPGGALSLRVVEPRYVAMVTACLATAEPFGVCLIAHGGLPGAPALHPVGTLADLVQAGTEPSGELAVSARGGRRFRLLARTVAADGLPRARVALLDEPARHPVPAAQQGLLPVLHRIADDLGPLRMPEPHDFDDAAWVGYRLAEAMPVQALAKQKLLELDDPVSRLEILHTYLSQRKLVE